jgi:hypothetical protein
MTVAELIEKLSQIENQEALVMTSGYEGGYDDADPNFVETDMVLNVNSEWYYGKHERAEDVYGKYESVKAIIL